MMDIFRHIRVSSDLDRRTVILFFQSTYVRISINWKWQQVAPMAHPIEIDTDINIIILSGKIFDTKYIIKDPNKSNTQKYFRHSNVKRYELALLRSGYFFYFSLLYEKNFWYKGIQYWRNPSEKKDIVWCTSVHWEIRPWEIRPFVAGWDAHFWFSSDLIIEIWIAWHD